MLRHDPDIILVGEIRDNETADITARAAMTGHLVFSTLHTNSAVGAVNRLLDLGLPPYLISSSLIGVMGQRLIRKICVHCKTEYEPSDDEKKSAGEKVLTYYHGAGCENCRQTGYAGRTGIYEILEVNDGLRDMIGRHLNEQEIFDELKRKGFRTMWDDGLAKVIDGTTTITEVLRACRNS
jgi:type II secretory ATPase GspE/PulE/Tfp pilus assembly ATPase PilB-like protein